MTKSRENPGGRGFPEKKRKGEPGELKDDSLIEPRGPKVGKHNVLKGEKGGGANRGEKSVPRTLGMVKKEKNQTTRRFKTKRVRSKFDRKKSRGPKRYSKNNHKTKGNTSTEKNK